MKKKPIWAICIMSIMSILCTGCCLPHDWEEATCTTPKTCAKCGETKGEALGHDWQEATCTEAKICAECGKTKGEALGHKWQEATCTEAKTCSVCEETEGEALGHKWQEAACQAPKTCSVCGETEGEATGHIWQEANCQAPKTCSICGETEGGIGDHIWADVTCQAPKTCSVCGETEGEIASHNFNENGICIMCGASREIQLTMDNVNDFLTVTYAVEKGITYNTDGNRRRIEGSGDTFWKDKDWYTVTVSPISNDYVFQNVQVMVGYDVLWTNDGTVHHYDSIFYAGGRLKELNTYSLNDDGIVIIEFAHTDEHRGGGKLYYTYIEDFMITEVSGTCIRK